MHPSVCIFRDVLPVERDINLMKKMPLSICDEIMIRATAFNFQTPMASLQSLVFGLRGSVRERPLPAAREPPSGSHSSRLFAGTGHRLGSAG